VLWISCRTNPQQIEVIELGLNKKETVDRIYVAEIWPFAMFQSDRSFINIGYYTPMSLFIASYVSSQGVKIYFDFNNEPVLKS